MVRAVIAPEYGSPAELRVVDVEVPHPGPGHLNIRVVAAGVNPSDAKLVRGQFGRGARLPLRPGSEVSGVVSAVGGSDVPFAVGDEVVAYRVAGGYAEELQTTSATVLRKPPTLSWHEAAGLLLTGVTAYHLLEATHVGAGDTVLIHGASGSVGLLAVQLARIRGARVIGTASERNHELLARFGAEPVAYGPGLVERIRAVAPHGIDAALDTVGTDEALDVSVVVTPLKTRIATIAGFARASAIGGIKKLGGGPGADAGSSLRNAARGTLLQLAGEGRLEVTLGASFALEQAAEALALVEGGHAGGKVVLTTGYDGT
ncbi:NADP-dependent oxidoreductase [Microbacteriaceae bacterium VKM Ac-2855]|nr:NADP-dependent oxidoreductase [Microbacteriaceae bacterium VKM Ac-2855]